MTNPSSDAQLFTQLKTGLFTAVAGDEIDVIDYRNQFLPAGITPIQREMKAAGRAMPVLEADVFLRRSTRLV